MKNSVGNINQELEAIKIALQSFPGGASIEEIKAMPSLDLKLRTLQRRLEKLQSQGLVRVTGHTRSTLYHLVADKEDSQINGETETALIPLSKEGKEVYSLTKRPQQQRKPVGYNPDFLQSYRPNRDSYLTEAEKKKLADIGRTVTVNEAAGTYAKQILHRLLIDLSWNSSRLEGNTYTLLDTERLISQGEAADNKSATDAQMILNHKDAIEFIVRDPENIRFNRYTILNLHALLSNNLLPDPAASGRLRRFGVGIHQSVYTPLAIPQQVEAMFNLILEKAEQIDNPFEQAFFIMVQLPYLQPFDDVNKRVSRLAANIPLNRHNLSPLSFIDVPNDLYIQGMIGIYEFNKTELLKDVFLWAYERSCARYSVLRQSLGEPDPFRLKYRDAIKDIIAEIIAKALPQKEAIIVINEKAVALPKPDQPKFIESVETELMSLHEGNFARYLIRPVEFTQWKDVWTNKGNLD